MTVFLFVFILVVLIAMFVFILKVWRSVKVLQEANDEIVLPRGRDRSFDNYVAPQSPSISMDMVNELVRRQLEAEKASKAVELVQEKPAQGFGNLSEGDLQRLLQAVNSGGGA